jgi:ATP-dependent RNA helicase RhlE
MQPSPPTPPLLDTGDLGLILPMPPTFTALGISPPLILAVAELGFDAPTAIQTQAIPAMLLNRDLLGIAQTGSGKTAAFALPLLERLLAQEIPHRIGATGPKLTRALVLVPTRELAAQVGEVFRSLALHFQRKPKIVVAFGGVSINPQLMSLRGGADVIIATPGRLLDLAQHNAIRLQHVETLVLDEADRLLDQGFADELRAVLMLLPEQRQHLFFSATSNPEVDALVGELAHEPLRLDLGSRLEPDPIIEQRVFHVDDTRRTQLLVHLFKANEWDHVMVFAGTQYNTVRVAEKLQRAKIYATAFHGGLSQGARTQAMDEFKARRWQVLVTTDLAARGIHVPKLPVVVNYDLPRSANDYLHRIGRTGRAGESGLAVSFVSSASEAHFQLIEKRQGLSLPREIAAGFEPLSDHASPIPLDARQALALAQATGGVKGKRVSKKDRLRAAAAGATTPPATTPESAKQS